MRAFIENWEEEIEKLFDAKNVGGIPSKKVKCRENAKIAAAFHIRF